MRCWVVLTVFVAACDHHESACGSAGGREPDEYVGCASDENWCTISEAEATSKVGDDQAPTITAPMAGTALSPSPKPVFTWTRAGTDPGAVDGDVPYMNGPDCQNCCPQFNTGALGTQHLPVVSGNVYDLHFTVDGALAHRVLTSLQRWTPADAVWQSWRGKTVSLRI